MGFYIIPPTSVGEAILEVTIFETIAAGTAGNVTLPTGASIRLDAWASGVDALVSTMAGGRPEFRTPVDAGGAAVTATLDAAGAYTLSAAPTAYPVGLIYVVRVLLEDYTQWTAAMLDQIIDITGLHDLPTPTRGDLTVGNAEPRWDTLAAGGVNTVLLSDGTDPYWAAGAPAVAHNLLSATHGDTTIGAAVRGDIVIGVAGPTWSKLAVGGVNTVLLSDGTDPYWAAAAPAVAHNLLSATHGDTTIGAAVRGDIVVGVAGPTWSNLVIGGAAGSFLRRDANDPGWSTLILPNAATQGDLLVATGANTVGSLVDVAAGQPLLSGGIGAVPAYAGWTLAGTAAQTYTFGTTGGTISTSPGTLTVATANATTAAGVHTHAITSSSNPGAAASILATDASGNIDIYGHFALGASASVNTDRVLNLVENTTGLASSQYGLYFYRKATLNANSGFAVAGVGGFSDIVTTGWSATYSRAVVGGNFAGYIGGSGTAAGAAGIQTFVNNYGAGTLTNAYSIYVRTNANSGTLTNSYGVYLEAQTEGVNNWGVYQVGTEDNYFRGRVGIGGVSSPGAICHMDQPSTTAAIPVLTLDQADVDIVLMKIIGTAAAASADRTLVADSDFGTPGALAGWIQIEIDDVGNRIADGDYYVPIHAVPT